MGPESFRRLRLDEVGRLSDGGGVPDDQRDVEIGVVGEDFGEKGSPISVSPSTQDVCSVGPDQRPALGT